MKCQYESCEVEFDPVINRNGKLKLYCKPSHKAAAARDRKYVKRKNPKRIRSRERNRLYTIIHKGETLEQLRAQARKKKES